MSRRPVQMRRARRAPGRRGYSLPEILIASALMSLLLLGTLRWVTGLVDVSATHADLTRPRTTARFVTEQFRTDVASGTVCHPAGIGGVVHAISDDTLALYADDDGDGDVDVVWWRYDATSGAVERQVVAGGGTCTFATDTPTGGWTALATSVVRDGDQPVFSGIGGRLDGYTGACTGLAAEDCLFHAVRVQLVATSPVTGFPAPADATAKIDLSGSRL